MRPDFSICIPTWNNAQMLLDCIYSIIDNIEANYVIHVLNNGKVAEDSGKTFQEFMAERTPTSSVFVHDLGENKGWMGALNYAYANGLMDARYVLILNDDTVIRPYDRRFLHELAKWMENDADVGMVGPVTNVAMGSQNFGLRGLPIIHGTTVLIGFCCAIRREVLDDIAVDGMVWDETLPGGDDLDLSIRVRAAGYHLLVDRTVYLHHHGFQTGRRVHGDWWNSNDQRTKGDNAIIRKHGLLSWFNCLQSNVFNYIGGKAVLQNTDMEGDWIRSNIPDGIGLDVGCGANKTVPDAIGVDRTPSGDAGKTGGSRDKIAVTDIQADICDIPLADNTQDFIVARHVLEHILDPFQALSEWYRLLKPGGTLVLACPDQDVSNTMILDAEHVHAYTPDSLQSLLSKMGFDVTDRFLVRPGWSFCIKATKLTGTE